MRAPEATAKAMGDARTHTDTHACTHAVALNALVDTHTHTHTYACTHAAAVKTLVDPPCSALLDLKDHNGYTALMICTFCDRAAAAEILLKAGASVSATS
eukprot:1139245-Pelagomonas_calceolata.AAC.3